MDRHRRERDEREATRKEAYLSEHRLQGTFKELSLTDTQQAEKKRSGLAERAKYQFEATESDDGTCCLPLLPLLFCSELQDLFRSSFARHTCLTAPSFTLSWITDTETINRNRGRIGCEYRRSEQCCNKVSTLLSDSINFWSLLDSTSSCFQTAAKQSNADSKSTQTEWSRQGDWSGAGRAEPPLETAERKGIFYCVFEAIMHESSQSAKEHGR